MIFASGEARVEKALAMFDKILVNLKKGIDELDTHIGEHSVRIITSQQAIEKASESKQKAAFTVRNLENLLGR